MKENVFITFNPSTAARIHMS